MVPAIRRASNPATASLLHLRQRSSWLLAAVLLSVAVYATAADPDDELRGPDIVIIAEPDRTIYEFRQAGELRMVRIEPRVGNPYYLVPRDPTRGFGDLERADMLLPSWVLLEF